MSPGRRRALVAAIAAVSGVGVGWLDAPAAGADTPCIEVNLYLPTGTSTIGGCAIGQLCLDLDPIVVGGVGAGVIVCPDN
jgi:hypothetical protein